uniref:Uncharacterized protein n=1 Tax=Anguilla anguilla TaxID=7936 RepID=A0A0E9QR55_ANGAN
MVTPCAGLGHNARRREDSSRPEVCLWRCVRVAWDSLHSC